MITIAILVVLGLIAVALYKRFHTSTPTGSGGMPGGSSNGGSGEPGDDRDHGGTDQYK